tara:strand:+ start:2196 stop:2543 length:348 start_codon:yes stop_codon:yes gene_type:complete
LVDLVGGVLRPGTDVSGSDTCSANPHIDDSLDVQRERRALGCVERHRGQIRAALVVNYEKVRCVKRPRLAYRQLTTIIVRRVAPQPIHLRRQALDVSYATRHLDLVRFLCSDACR